jgi:hypothetical protein
MTPEHKHIAGLELARKELLAAGYMPGSAPDLIVSNLIAKAKSAPEPEPVQGEAVDLLEYVRLTEQEVEQHGIGAVYWENAVSACQAAIRASIMAAAKPDAEPTTKDRLAVAEPAADLIAILIDAQMAVQDMQEVHDDQADWASAGAMVGLNDRIDAKLAELRK